MSGLTSIAWWAPVGPRVGVLLWLVMAVCAVHVGAGIGSAGCNAASAVELEAGFSVTSE